MIGANLAEVYDIATKRLNEQVKRNAERFPEDFMFRLTVGEKAELVAKCDHLARLNRRLPVSKKPAKLEVAICDLKFVGRGLWRMIPACRICRSGTSSIGN